MHLGFNTQAGRIIKKAGGFDRLAKLLEAVGKPRHRSAVYRWNKPKNKGGTGGMIPSSALRDVVLALRYDGTILTNEDLFPDLYPDPEVVEE